MSTRRKHLGCAVFNNYIYAVGGRDDCMELSSAERYNPHTNTWSPIVAMTSRRSGVSWWKKKKKIIVFTIFALIFPAGWASCGQWSIIRGRRFRWFSISKNYWSLWSWNKSVASLWLHELQTLGWWCGCYACTANWKLYVVR